MVYPYGPRPWGWGGPGWGGFRWPWEGWFSRPYKQWGYGSHLHVCQKQAAREYQKRVIDIQRKYNMNNWWYYPTPLDPSQIQQYYAEINSARTEYHQQYYRCQSQPPSVYPYDQLPPGYISPGYPRSGYPNWWF